MELKILGEIRKMLKELDDSEIQPIDEFTAYDRSFNNGARYRLERLETVIENWQLIDLIERNRTKEK